MLRFVTLPARINIYTYKEGLLSRFAHDLQLSVHEYAIELLQGHVSARFDPSSLRVDGAVHRGVLDERTLSEGDRTKIEAAIVKEVLDCQRHPEVRFEAALIHDGNGRFTARGALSIMGRDVAIELPITLHDDRVRGDLELIPSRWGIAPFRAMAGALKVQDRVRVVFDLPVDPQVADTTDWHQFQSRWSSAAQRS